MKVHWLRRWDQIPYGPKNIVLQGALPKQMGCSFVVNLLSDNEDASALVFHSA
jgi:hypothetical protein